VHDFQDTGCTGGNGCAAAGGVTTVDPAVAGVEVVEAGFEDAVLLCEQLAATTAAATSTTGHRRP
jgi:hypothetical protein